MRERRIKKVKKENMLGLAFVVCILLFMMLNAISRDVEMSAQQNRMLAQRPKLSLEGILSGTYMERYEEYMKDQFVGSDLLQRMQVGLKRIGGSRLENGIFIGKEDQLTEDIVVPDQETLTENLEAINLFAEKNDELNMYMILVPDSANILEAKLPKLATVEDQDVMFSQVEKQLEDSVKWIDAMSILDQHSDEYIYYRTDRHWTSQGAFYVFADCTETMGIDIAAPSSFVAYPISTTFNGILSANSGVKLNETDDIYIYVQKENAGEVIVNRVEEQKKTTSLYDSSKLETRNQYDVFLGGDTALIDIKTVSTSERRLLLIKDSFANCFVPFLEPYFREIVVVDPRYYSGTIDEIMDTYRITDVLFLYGGNTFFQDNNINGVFSSEQ
ncbi:MAG: DHHW family protein [Schaedlerella sp.]|nr:DHHW family protein [Schaedlerella sp.]